MKKGKKNNLSADVGLLLSASQEAKRAKYQRRLVNYVISVNNPEEQLEKTTQIATELEKAYLKNEKIKPLYDSLFREVSAVLFENRKFELLLHLFMQVEANPCLQQRAVGGDISALSKLALGNIHYNDLRDTGRQQLLISFFRFVGETLEKSITFALYLMEKFGEMTKSSYEKKSASAEELNYGGAAYMIIVRSASSPPHRDTPMRLWLFKIMEAAKNNAAAEIIFDSISNVLAWGTKDNFLKIVEISAESDKDTTSLIMNSASFDLIHEPLLVLTPDEHKLLRSLPSRTKEQENIKEGEKALNWFTSRNEVLSQRYRTMTEAIASSAKRGLRAGGVDHFDIKLAPLRNIGIKSVIFYPEREVFPNIGLEFIIRKETPHCIKFSGRIKEFQLETLDVIFNNATHKDFGLLRKLLEYVLIDILYRIMVEEKELKPKKVKQANGSLDYPKNLPIRPQIRRLPQGFKASQEALDRARQLHQHVPHGYTFIKAHFRSGRIELSLSTESIGTYSDDDFYESGGEE